MTTRQTDDNRDQPSSHQRALELARQGRHAEALSAIQEHLLACPADGEALNDAGALLYALGRYDEAARHLQTALDRLPDKPPQVLENLLEVRLAAGHGEQALGLLDQLAEAGALTGDLAGRVAAGLLQHNDCPRAAEAILRSLGPGPRGAGPDAAMDEVLREIRRRRPRVGLFLPAPAPDADPDARRLYDLLRSRFETTVYRGRGGEDLAVFLRSCDIAWFEGCSPEAVHASRLPKCCQLGVRVGPAEAYGPAIDNVHWAGVDLVATSAAGAVREFLARRLGDLGGSGPAAGTIVHVPRGIDVDALPMPPRTRGTNLACLSGLTPAGNCLLLLE